MSALVHTSFSVEKSSLRFVRKMNGTAQSLLVEDADRKLWVLKPNNCLQGPNALANEFIGSELMRTLGIRTPESKCIHLDVGSFAQPEAMLNTPCGRTSVAGGMHFMSRYVPDAIGSDVYEFIPPTLQSMLKDQSQILGMFVFDTWAIHSDRRQALFSIEESKLSPTFIDNSHLFGGPDWKCTKAYIYPQMLERVALQWERTTQASEDWVTRMQNVIPDALERAVTLAPTTWFQDDVRALVAKLLHRLDDLSFLIRSALAEVECRLENISGVEQLHRGSDFRILSHRGTARWA